MDCIGADIICIQETKIDTNFGYVKKGLCDVIKQFWKCSDVIMSTLSINTGLIHKPGGTMLITHSSLTEQTTKRYYDRMGRWSAASYSCKNGCNLTTIICYQVCINKASQQGIATACKQQQQILCMEKRSPEPRTPFCTDLQIFINTLQKENHHIVLIGNFNNHMTKHQASFLKWIKNLNLIDPMTQYQNL